jgi:hypothetical protein
MSMPNTPTPPRPRFWRRKSFWYYAVMGAFLWHMVVYDYGMYFLTLWQSKPYNEKIETMIAEGRTELPLKEIYDDFEWDFPCTVNTVHDFRYSGGGCLLTQDDLQTSNRYTEKEQRFATVEYTVKPANFKITHDQSVLLLIDQKNKVIHVKITNRRIWGTTLIEGLEKPPFFQVISNSYGAFLETTQRR